MINMGKKGIDEKFHASKIFNTHLANKTRKMVMMFGICEKMNSYNSDNQFKKIENNAGDINEKT